MEDDLDDAGDKGEEGEEEEEEDEDGNKLPAEEVDGVLPLVNDMESRLIFGDVNTTRTTSDFEFVESLLADWSVAAAAAAASFPAVLSFLRNRAKKDMGPRGLSSSALRKSCESQ